MFDQQGVVKQTSLEEFRSETAKILSPFLDGQLVTDLIMAFLKTEPNQSIVVFERLATLIEFTKLHPAQVKRVKTTATGMDMILKPEQYLPTKAKESADPIVDH